MGWKGISQVWHYQQNNNNNNDDDDDDDDDEDDDNKHFGFASIHWQTFNDGSE